MTERFKELLLKLGLSPSEFADRIGVQRSSISHIVSGRNKPSIDFLEKILAEFPDIDLKWLISGRVTSSEASIKDTEPVVNELIKSFIPEAGPMEKEKPPAPQDEEPVVQIIFVYKNNTFRILDRERNSSN